MYSVCQFSEVCFVYFVFILTMLMCIAAALYVRVTYCTSERVRYIIVWCALVRNFLTVGGRYSRLPKDFLHVNSSVMK